MEKQMRVKAEKTSALYTMRCTSFRWSLEEDVLDEWIYTGDVRFLVHELSAQVRSVHSQNDDLSIHRRDATRRPIDVAQRVKVNA